LSWVGPSRFFVVPVQLLIVVCDYHRVIQFTILGHSRYLSW